jgi:hypothetical protein
MVDMEGLGSQRMLAGTVGTENTAIVGMAVGRTNRAMVWNGSSTAPIQIGVEACPSPGPSKAEAVCRHGDDDDEQEKSAKFSGHEAFHQKLSWS